MRIDFTTVLLDTDGTPLTADDKEVTLKTVAVNALVSQIDKDEEGAAKFDRWAFARKISANPNRHVKEKDLELIKTRIGKIYGPMIVGPAWQILSGRAEDEDEDAIVQVPGEQPSATVNGLAN